MSGFEQLPQSIQADLAQTAAVQPTSEQTAFAHEELDDTTALGLVLSDVTSAINYLQSKGLVPTLLDQSDELVRAYLKPRFWSDNTPKANMQFFTVLESIEKIMPVLYMAMFGTGKRRPFEVEPIGKTSPEAARAKASLLNWCIKESGLKEEMRRMLKTVLTYGFAVGSYGWKSVEHKVRRISRDADGKIKREWVTQTINLPTFEALGLRRVLIDPKCDRQDIQVGARFFVKQHFITANDLDDMRQDDSYKNIPSNEELREILRRKQEPTEDSLSVDKRTAWHQFQAMMEQDSADTADPLMQDLEYLEYWTGTRVIGVLQRKIVIRNEILGDEFKGIPGVSCAFVDVLGSAWGFGVARLLAGDQKLQTGVGNSWIDSLALVLNPVFQLLKGIGPGTQNIPLSPGKVVNVGGELKPLVAPDVTATALQAIETSSEWASKRVGANSASNMPSQALRTGTGVQAFTGDVVQRLQYFLEIFINLIYLPVLQAYLRMAVEKMEPEQIQHILTEEEGKAWEGDIADVYNAQVDVDVIAGADLMAKFAASQLAPMIVQLISATPVQDSLVTQGKKFNYSEFAQETLDLMGWDISPLFSDATQDDMNRAVAMNAAHAKGAADANLQNQKHQDDMELANEKGFIQAGVAVVKQGAKTNLDVAQTALENMNQNEAGTPAEDQEEQQ